MLPTGVLPGGRFDDWHPGRPRYVVCDVDGTLVGPEQLSAAEVVDAVGRAQAAGIRVGYATGRMRDGVARLHEQLGGLGPHLLHNGAEVRADGATIATWPLTPADVDALLAIARSDDDVYVEIYPEAGFFVSSWDERARPHWDAIDAEPRGVIASADELAGAAVRKATFAVFSPGITDRLCERVAAIGLLPGPAGSPRTPGLDYVNATHPDAGKGRALHRAADHLGIGLDEVIAIGDAHNDLPMLEVAGTAIAMGQAPHDVRAAAHLVVPAVDAHGVAVAIDAALGMRTTA